jgi:hypothetical protein
MRNLLRKPLPWMVLAECAIVAALIIVAWHMIANAPAQVVPVLPATSPAAAGDASGPVSADLPAQPTPHVSAPPPGLNVDATFWRERLAELNRGQAAFEALEWRIVRSAMDAAHRYVESVVIPAIARAERRGT